MSILIFLEGAGPDREDAVRRATEGLGASISIARPDGRAALIAALGDLPRGVAAVLLTPEDDGDPAPLRTALAGLAAFTVEVQPDPPSRGGPPFAGASAEFRGLGDAAYRHAVQLISDRAAR